MALELVGGAVLGVLFDQFQNEICKVKDNVVMFKPKLEELEETLTELYPVIEEIAELNRRLNRPNHVPIKLRGLLEEGTKLVSKCSKIPRWDIFKQGRYRQKLVELDNKILRFHNLYLQAHMARDLKQTFLVVEETRQMVVTMSLKQQGGLKLTVKRIVFKKGLYDEKFGQKARKLVSGISGLDSVALDMRDKKMTLVGDIDSMAAVKKLCCTNFVSFGYNKDKKEDAETNNKKKQHDNIKVLMKLHGDRLKQKVMKAISGISGMESVIMAVHGKERIMLGSGDMDASMAGTLTNLTIPFREIRVVDGDDKTCSPFRLI